MKWKTVCREMFSFSAPTNPLVTNSLLSQKKSCRRVAIKRHLINHYTHLPVSWSVLGARHFFSSRHRNVRHFLNLSTTAPCYSATFWGKILAIKNASLSHIYLNITIKFGKSERWEEEVGTKTWHWWQMTLSAGGGGWHSSKERTT